MPQWDAEVTIDAELVRALLGEQFAELDASSARLLGEGWDNSVWLVEERLAFRFPRREIAVPGVEREIDLLPRLAARLPLPVPLPIHVGRPSERFRWPFFGCRVLHGDEPATAAPTDQDRVAFAPALGRFLHVLHAPETRAAIDPAARLPLDPTRRGDMPWRVARSRAQVDLLRAEGVWAAPAVVERILAEAERLPAASGPGVLAHGDLHVRHVLVAEGTLVGVIDWGDVCVADAAIDLSLVWSLLPPGGRDAFVEKYGPVSPHRRLRARVLALNLCSMLALYARDVGNASLERESLAGLERTLVDWS